MGYEPTELDTAEAQAELSHYIERIEKKTEEKSKIGSEITSIYNSAKSRGFNPKIMRLMIKLKGMSDEDRMLEEQETRTYKSALGMQQDMFDETAEAARRLKQMGATVTTPEVEEDED